MVALGFLPVTIGASIAIAAGTVSNIGAKFWAFIPVVVGDFGIDRTTSNARAISTKPAQ
jgi:hypothetical protein